jgi:hypothetical protein
MPQVLDLRQPGGHGVELGAEPRPVLAHDLEFGLQVTPTPRL